MYSNDEKRINWLDVIIRILFGALFILIIVWLFPKVPNMKAFYSNVFRENIKYMQEAGESYFTNDRLPKEIGDSVKLTLKEMQDKSLILPFVDKDGNSCNVYSSYVEVEKGENEYILKTNLVCNDEQNYINKVLGCYDYCEDCKEEEDVTKTALEYQFKKAVKTSYNKYTCPSGYTLNGTTCYKNTVVTKAANESLNRVFDYSIGANIGFYKDRLIEMNAPYTYTTIEVCPEGYVAIDNKCAKITTVQKTFSSKYTCSDGTLEGAYCTFTVAPIKGTPYKKNICTTTPGCINYVTVIPYSCPSGYTLSNNTCKKSIPASITTIGVCPSGYTDNGNNTCSKTEYALKVSSMEKSYYCPDSYTKIGSGENTKCIKYADGSTYYYCADSSAVLNGSKCDFYKYVKQFTCDSDYKLNSNNVCEKTITDTAAPTITNVEGVSYQYKWNDTKTLEGWTYTGNTRTVKI